MTYSAFGGKRREGRIEKGATASPEEHSRGKSIGLSRWMNRRTGKPGSGNCRCRDHPRLFHIYSGVWTSVGMLQLFPPVLRFCGLARCHRDHS